MPIYRDADDRRVFLGLKYERWGHVFGERFWCRPVPEEQLETVCIYVMMNPVRAGLCQEMGDWPWSACRFELG